MGSWWTACRRLSKVDGVTVLVGGRTLAKALAMCTDAGGNLKPVYFDASQELDKNLRTLAPDIVVDAAGPFQPAFKRGGVHYTLARSCIGLGIHYIDLSDSGQFTQGIVDWT